jgi:hypothetical protein
MPVVGPPVTATAPGCPLIKPVPPSGAGPPPSSPQAANNAAPSSAAPKIDAQNRGVDERGRARGQDTAAAPACALRGRESSSMVTSVAAAVAVRRTFVSRATSAAQ